MATTKPTLGNMPNEILLETLKHLPLTELANLKSTSKHLNAIVTDHDLILANSLIATQQTRLRSQLTALDFRSRTLPSAFRAHITWLTTLNALPPKKDLSALFARRFREANPATQCTLDDLARLSWLFEDFGVRNLSQERYARRMPSLPIEEVMEIILDNRREAWWPEETGEPWWGYRSGLDAGEWEELSQELVRGFGLPGLRAGDRLAYACRKGEVLERLLAEAGGGDVGGWPPLQTFGVVVRAPRIRGVIRPVVGVFDRGRQVCVFVDR
ncbi:hypothetical protein LTR32_003151 [Rachicladosporium monterosium]|uniref:F-box domain-containing protein n=1 Tax=Rachicladosporium monterosium TaxID=1507873 RepID=A0ABR0L9N0_9PEZI|nr:hypothetical protein LTR32_003151 [Rachicladosporium monterosium]